MFKFSNEFDMLEDDKVILKIIEKNPGNEQMIPFYYYDIYEKNSLKQIGKISIRIGQNYHSYYNGNIGYEINEDARGHNYSYYAANLVLRIAMFHGMKEIIITCSKDNTASKKIIEKLGAELIEIIKVPRDYFGYHENMDKQRIYKLYL